MKTLLILALLGADLGIIVASYAVPPALSWYSEPAGLPNGTQIQALVEIPKVIHYATGKLIRGQLIGATAGAIGGVALGVFLRSRRKKSAAGDAGGSPPAPTAAPKP